MQAGLLCPLALILCIVLLTGAAGCLQSPAFSWFASSPDPVVGQWIAGEPPQTEFHMLFFENHTYLYSAYYSRVGERIERGNWTRMGAGQYTAETPAGNATSWIYDPSIDTLHMNGMPFLRFYRFRG